MATWTEDLADCLHAMFDAGDLFDLERVYRLVPILEQLHPDNESIREKIRQQLQVLRDEHMVDFVNDAGVYRWLGKSDDASPDAPRADDFRAALAARLDGAGREGQPHVDVNSGDLHREVGGYPGPAHRMPACCNVLRAAMRTGDEVIEAPPSGMGASLTIRFKLPR